MTESVQPVSSRMICAGCGAEAFDPPVGRYPFRCGHAKEGDNIDHVLTRVNHHGLLHLPEDDEPNPFVKFRRLFHTYHLARQRGMTDAQYLDLVHELDAGVADVDGRGFRTTPFTREARLSERLQQSGGIWVKNETGNVSGSHKARHLMGIMLYLKVLERLGYSDHPQPPLAIASCGNAALAAAVVARAAGRQLQVFIPPDASPAVVSRLERLGARLTVCVRQAGVAGDPCYLRFREAEHRGALPFCCQGSANGLTIEGGETLGYEMLATPHVPALDRVVVQVGGGALISAVVQAFSEGVTLGACPKLPRIHAVQTQGASPLARAYDKLAGRIAPVLGVPVSATTTARADAIAARFNDPVVQRELHRAVTHRGEFMWPWEEAPHSIAHGILDDETYDWFAVMKGMLQSGGFPLVVDEASLEDAHAVARATTTIRADHTGTAGLAGVLHLRKAGLLNPKEHLAVILSGVERG